MDLKKQFFNYLNIFVLPTVETWSAEVFIATRGNNKTVLATNIIIAMKSLRYRTPVTTKSLLEKAN